MAFVVPVMTTRLSTSVSIVVDLPHTCTASIVLQTSNLDGPFGVHTRLSEYKQALGSERPFGVAIIEQFRS